MQSEELSKDNLIDISEKSSHDESDEEKKMPVKNFMLREFSEILVPY